MKFFHHRDTFRRDLWAALGGLCQAGSMGLPFHGGAHGALQWLAMLILAHLTLSSRTSRACVRGAFVFQSVALAMTFWWIFISLHVYGEMNALLAAFGVFALACALALYWSGFAWLFYQWGVLPCVGEHLSEPLPKDTTLKKPMSSSGGALQIFRQRAFLSSLFAASWLLSELCRAQWFTGFPWGSSGYAHNDTWMALGAPYLGVYGIGAFSAFLGMWVAHVLWLKTRAHTDSGTSALREIFKHSPLVAWVVLPLLSLVVWPLVVHKAHVEPIGSQGGAGQALSVELLQGNVPQQTKFRNDRFTAAQWYYDQMVSSKAELVVTPETAFAMTLDELPRNFLEAIQNRLVPKAQAVLFGIPSKDGQAYANSALGLVGASSEVYRYDKVHLVPFGEFIPPFFRWFTDQMQMPLGFFNPGPVGQRSLKFLGQRIAPNICYEDLFGEELAVQFLDKDEAPSILVNLSNIAWFGDTVILDQHLEISRMRTLELRRPMIRATNSGATAVIDHLGQVRVLAPAFQRQKVSASVEGRFEEPTFFAWWAARWGLLPLWGLGLWVLGVGGLGRLWARAKSR